MVIVEQSAGVWRVVHQPDHAAVSGELAKRWCRPTGFPEAFWPRLIEAARRHDDGWYDAEQSPSLDENGHPYNFKQHPTPEHLAIWRKAVSELAADDVYVAMLVALHGRWLYTHLVEVSQNHGPDVQAFLDEQNEFIDQTIRQLQTQGEAAQAAVSANNLNFARRLVGFTDAMSLMLAGAIPVQPFPEALSFGGQREELALAPVDPCGLQLAPWPFEGDAFEVQMTVRSLAVQSFASGEQFAQVLASQPANSLRCVIEPGSSLHE